MQHARVGDGQPLTGCGGCLLIQLYSRHIQHLQGVEGASLSCLQAFVGEAAASYFFLFILFGTLVDKR